MNTLKIHSTHDGRFVYIVATKNQKEAARLLGRSLASLNNYPGCSNQDSEEKALRSPGVVFRRRIGDDWAEWRGVNEAPETDAEAKDRMIAAMLAVASPEDVARALRLWERTTGQAPEAVVRSREDLARRVRGLLTDKCHACRGTGRFPGAKAIFHSEPLSIRCWAQADSPACHGEIETDPDGGPVDGISLDYRVDELKRQFDEFSHEYSFRHDCPACAGRGWQLKEAVTAPAPLF